MLFMNAQTQWRIGMNGVTGLDYAGVAAMARSMRQRVTPQIFSDIQLMEREALREFRKK